MPVKVIISYTFVVRFIFLVCFLYSTISLIFLYLGLKVFLAPEAVHASLCLDPKPKKDRYSHKETRISK